MFFLSPSRPLSMDYPIWDPDDLNNEDKLPRKEESSLSCDPLPSSQNASSSNDFPPLEDLPFAIDCFPFHGLYSLPTQSHLNIKPASEGLPTATEHEEKQMPEQDARISSVASQQLPVEGLTSVRLQLGIKTPLELANLSDLNKKTILTAEKNISRIRVDSLNRIIAALNKQQQSRVEQGFVPIPIPSAAWIHSQWADRPSQNKTSRLPRTKRKLNQVPDCITDRKEMVKRFEIAMKGLSQNEVASKSKAKNMEISQTTICRALNPDERVQLKHLTTLANILNVNILDLINHDSPALKKMKNSELES